MRGERIEVYPGKDGAWRWRRVAGNHRMTSSSGESFDTKDNAWRAAEEERENTPEVPVYEVES
jgi:uncharacterized protein YegP (UPF0339 family)